MQQVILSGNDIEKQLTDELQKQRFSKILLVHGKSFENMEWKKYFDAYDVIHFSDFEVNPKYEDALKGKRLLEEHDCDMIVAVGGGSAIDTAKCIKAFSNMDENRDFLSQQIQNSDIPLVAIPTTAGTGSESTHFAVIYYNGNKYSVADASILPDIAVLDVRVLDGLPHYQRKVTMCDALAHAIESYWCVNATIKSRQYAKSAIIKISKIWNRYITDGECKEEMLLAANNAGRAINISKTTAGHAMSYKLTSMFGLAHGQAVIICLPKIWKHMIGKSEALDKILGDISEFMGCKNSDDAIEMIEHMIDKMELNVNIELTQAQIDEIATSVNVERLSNNPVKFDEQELKQMYKEILCGMETV